MIADGSFNTPVPISIDNTHILVANNSFVAYRSIGDNDVFDEWEVGTFLN